MSDQITLNHLERLRSRTIEKFTMDKIPEWVEKHTYINGRNYSFKDHEYQSRILGDTSQEIVIRKCSQIGMSEASSRFGLALTAVNPYYTVIYTLPTASFASDFMKTRIDPIIQSSQFLTEMIHKTTDNTEVKRFGDSYFYMRGCQSNNAPISVPADHLVHDEVDFSSEDVISKYQSRLTHSPYKRKTFLSTPTFPGIGIDKLFAQSRRHFNMVKCDHCNHWFVPSYYDHVRIPGWDGDLREVTKNHLGKIRFLEAAVHCPRCGDIPSLQLEHREYVCENPDERFLAVGYQVSPFDAPNIHMRGEHPMSVAAFLVNASVNYKKVTDFVNFNLGLPAEDSESTITREDLERCLFEGDPGKDGTYVMGLDMGLTCYLTIGKVMSDGRLIVVYLEEIPAARVIERRQELARIYWPRMTVTDNLPYTETVMRMQTTDQNLFGAWYEEKKSLELYRVKEREEDEDEGEQEIRQVYINRNKAFDALMLDLRSGYILKKKDEHDEIWMKHLMDMKRGLEFGRDNELSYVWKKSSAGEDHYHHSLLYLYIASKMMGVSSNRVPVSNLIRRFKTKGKI